MISEPEALALWEQALAEPFGLAIRTDHRRNLMNRLYTIRAKTKNEDLKVLQCMLPADPEWLWIKRKIFEQPPVRQVSEDDLDSL